MSLPAVSPAWLATGIALADAARPIARQYFRSRLAIDTKSDLSPVTIADQTIEAAMRKILAEAHPDHGILGEDHGADRTDADYVWVLDPIDGTRAFICGVPTFGVLISLCYQGRPIFGIVDHPALGERWIGGIGLPTTWNGEPCHARACTRLADAYLFATSPDMFKGAQREAFTRLEPRVKERRFGLDCFAAGLIAGGHIDAMVETSLQPYDYCALVPVLEQAGATITDWEGKPLTIHSNGSIIAAATAELHGEILAALA
jgi:inositol-phosphate phosphatase/L-galactose 1-phosphate phosphatase/histidinol-phosphatase